MTYRSLKLCLAVIVATTVSFTFSDTLRAQKIMAIEGAQIESESKGKSLFLELLETNDLSHFRGYQTEEIPAGWTVQGKTLIFDGTGSGDVITRETFKDFELHVEWNISEGGNSGIMYRVGLGDSQPYLTGPEIQILDDEKHGDNAHELTSAGALYGLYPAENKRLKPAGQWNKSRIIVENNKVVHRLNGHLVFEADMGSEDWNKRVADSKFKDWPKFNSLEEGHLAFQNHGDAVKFRNIRIKRLNEDAASDDAVGSDATPPTAPGDRTPIVDPNLPSIQGGPGRSGPGELKDPPLGGRGIR